MTVTHARLCVCVCACVYIGSSLKFYHETPQPLADLATFRALAMRPDTAGIAVHESLF